ncbi:response regulator [Aggregicoccus sp. 17bor-14]|uniref:response regulator n=1 Tax=Myxococcaceae TaxID=31 RepID=UPI00129C25A1|nr:MULTISPECIES: response regulator [Myxococcaceae]MBF5042119.1 response regulator [Simulacricoccus sp. 17bor-14]MRI87896.1 response regulator [Aggregicoccus sp. 17bor-14]
MNSSDSTPPCVLIVDDDLFVRRLLEDALSASGLELRVLEAADGEEGVAVATRERPQVVLLDLFMPRMSGLQALGMLRAAVPETRVVVISSMDAEPVIEQALQAGAAGFIAKPFHPLEIAAAVREALAG